MRAAIPPGVHFSEIGTFASIEASLGGAVRQSCLFICVLLVLAVVPSSPRKRWFAALSVAGIGVLLCPWLSALLSHYSAANLSWRMAWAFPAAPLLAIGGGLLCSSGPWRWPRVVCATGLAILFLCSGRTVLSPGNGVTFAPPGPTLPPEYRQTQALLDLMKATAPAPVVLAVNPPAAWIPLAAPGTPLIMPGHMYPTMLATLLDKREFEERTWLFSNLSTLGRLPAKDLERYCYLLLQYRVSVLVVEAAKWDEMAATIQLEKHGIGTQKLQSSGIFRMLRIWPLPGPESTDPAVQ